jgi:carboxymethylenebutenolidase
MLAETITLLSNGEAIEAYTARPLDAGPRGGVVVIHHMPGYDAATKEITRRFAANGYNAISPNLHCRCRRGRRLAEGSRLFQRQGRHDRVLLRRAPVLPRRLSPSDRRRR